MLSTLKDSIPFGIINGKAGRDDHSISVQLDMAVVQSRRTCMGCRFFGAVVKWHGLEVVKRYPINMNFRVSIVLDEV